VRALGAAEPPPPRLLDLGCGTGAAGAAWALEASPAPFVEAVDRSGWAVEEARFALARLGIDGRVRRADLEGAALPGAGGAILAAFTVNELTDEGRARLLPRLLGAARRGARVLVVEPLARRPSPWWSEWAQRFVDAGGREDEWRFPTEPPETAALLGKAAGLRPREISARSLWLG
jgi:SAM-dependent methyltransferase